MWRSGQMKSGVQRNSAMSRWVRAVSAKLASDGPFELSRQLNRVGFVTRSRVLSGAC